MNKNSKIKNNKSLPENVCEKCFMKKQAWVGNSQICWDCGKKEAKPLDLILPEFMLEEELKIFNKLSLAEQEKHLQKAKKENPLQKNSCSQCHQEEMCLKFMDKYYCADCWKYQTEAEKSGLNSTYRYIKEKCSCEPCENRTNLSKP